MVPSVDDIVEVAVGFVIATVALSVFYVAAGVSNMEELTAKLRSILQ